MEILLFVLWIFLMAFAFFRIDLAHQKLKKELEMLEKL